MALWKGECHTDLNSCSDLFHEVTGELDSVLRRYLFWHPHSILIEEVNSTNEHCVGSDSAKRLRDRSQNPAGCWDWLVNRYVISRDCHRGYVLSLCQLQHFFQSNWAVSIWDTCPVCIWCVYSSVLTIRIMFRVGRCWCHPCWLWSNQCVHAWCVSSTLAPAHPRPKRLGGSFSNWVTGKLCLLVEGGQIQKRNKHIFDSVWKHFLRVGEGSAVLEDFWSQNCPFSEDRVKYENCRTWSKDQMRKSPLAAGLQMFNSFLPH